MRRIYLSYTYLDQRFADLLKGQMNEVEDLSLLDIPPVQTSSIEVLKKHLIENLGKCSMVVSLVSPNYSTWQEFELQKAVEIGIPIVGINLTKQQIVPESIYEKYSIPIIEWNLVDLVDILRGEKRSLQYEEPEIVSKSSRIIQLDFQAIAKELAFKILKNPGELYHLTSRQFEELTAYLFEKNGYEVTLTKQTRDEGVDIYAVKKNAFGSFLTIVDCKRYAPNRPVGIEIVRSMYGVLNIENASHAMIATTSTFTSGAKKFEKKYCYQISLKDHADILEWIKRYSVDTRR